MSVRNLCNKIAVCSSTVYLHFTTQKSNHPYISLLLPRRCTWEIQYLSMGEGGGVCEWKWPSSEPVCYIGISVSILFSLNFERVKKHFHGVKILWFEKNKYVGGDLIYSVSPICRQFKRMDMS